MMNNFINVGLNIETFIYISIIIIGFTCLVIFLRINWRAYGLLFIIATIVGNILCYIFVKLGFYSYPHLLFPKISIMPFSAITFSFPIMVLIAVRYSPEKWAYKIPFYWPLIHFGLLGEIYAVLQTDIIEYGELWNLWTSYTWWWIYFLIFEWIGGELIPKSDRRPITIPQFSYGKIGWGIIHFILIVTIFLAGYYLGSLK